MENTNAHDVIDFFESSFQDKKEIPSALEMVWLQKAIGRYSVELAPIEFDLQTGAFATQLPIYVISTLATFMRQYYQERENSKVNKRVSIVTKSLSIDGNGNAKTAAKNELDYFKAEAEEMVSNQMTTSYV